MDKILKEVINDSGFITIGRKDCDILLEDKSQRVSRKHAVITKENGNYFVEDGDGRGKPSLHGVLLNGKLIPPCTKVKFDKNDVLSIQFYEIRLDEPVRDLSKELAIQANGIEKDYKEKKIIGKHGVKRALNKINLEVNHKEFIAVMGPSGCGKSTLLKILSNNLKPTEGEVYVHGYKSSSKFNLLKRKIGYVPQDDIVHKELSVEKTLFYAAKLRMGDRVTRQSIAKKISEVLEILFDEEDLKRILQQKVKALSGGQRKRISIALELLTDPSILFLDEPTSPLDPETIHEFLMRLNRLKEEKGITIIMVTHKPEDLKFVDKVIFLASGGYHVYYGSPKEMMNHFDCDDILKIYKRLSGKPDSKKKEAPSEDYKDIKYWYKDWLQKETKSSAVPMERALSHSRDSLLHQFKWLTIRYFQIKISDLSNVVLLVLQPVVIAGLIAFIFFNLQIGVIFLMAISSIWFGVSNSSKEIVGELSVLRRERMFNLNTFTYLCSKLSVLSLIAFVQVTIFILIIYATFQSSEIKLVNLWQQTLFMFYLTISASLLGLLLSSLYDSLERVLTLVPIILIPQIMLAGVITNIDTVPKEVLSYMTLGRWGTEGFASIQDNYPEYRIEREYYLMHHQYPDSIAMKSKKTIIESLYFPVNDTTSRSVYYTYLSGSGNKQLDYSKLSLNHNIRSSGEATLNYYQDHLLNLSRGEGIIKILVAISIINLIVFGIIIIALKNK